MQVQDAIAALGGHLLPQVANGLIGATCIPRLAHQHGFFPFKTVLTVTVVQILYKVSGCCRPGEVLAFMGPSGEPNNILTHLPSNIRGCR